MKPILSNENHARILYAYLARLTPAELIEIHERASEWQHASMNAGLSAQLDAQDGMMRAVLDATGNMLDHDKAIVEEVMRSAMANPA